MSTQLLDGPEAAAALAAGVDTSPEPSSAETPPAAAAWGTVAILLVFSLLSVLDRQIISLLVTPIKADLGLSDTQVGLLQGFAFGLFYSIAALPLGYLVDRYPRRLILYLGITFWSLSAAFCGLARSFAELFAGRIAVGAGEATLAPAAVSLISDLFPPDRVATPMGVYSAGYFLGSGLALAVGGAVVGLFAGQAQVLVPIVGAVSSWQVVFLVTGLPGLVIALLAFAITDPRKYGAPKPKSGAASGLRALFWERGGLLIRCFSGFALMSLISYAIAAWTPAFLERRFGLGPGQIGWSFGLAVSVSGAIGAFGGGVLLDRVFRSGRRDAYLLVSGVVVLLALPLLAGAYFMPTPELVLGMLALGMTGVGITGASSYATWRMVAPPALRGRVTAIFVLIVGLVGGGLGPVLVALVTDHVLGNEARVGEAIALVVGVMLPIASLLFLSSRCAMRAIPEG